MIEAGIATHLTSDPDVQAIVASRVYPQLIPQGGETSRQPCIVYQRVGALRGQTFCSTDRLVKASFQIDSYARRYTDSLFLGAAVRASLVDYAGAMGDTHVAKVSLETEIDLLDPEPGLYRVSQTYSIWYLEE